MVKIFCYFAFSDPKLVSRASVDKYVLEKEVLVRQKFSIFEIDMVSNICPRIC